MARVVVVGGGFAGMSAAARLAKLRHEVTLFEAGERLGGGLLGYDIDGRHWPLYPEPVTLPGVFRDLFRKSGRPMDQALGLEPTGGRRHLFTDGTVLDLATGRRSDQTDALLAAFGEDEEWTPWIDTQDAVWEVLRRRSLDVVLSGPDAFDRADRRALRVRRSIGALADRTVSDRRLAKLLLDPVRLAGLDRRSTPAFTAVWHYLERTFGRWEFEGGRPGLAAALERRLGERRVEVHLGHEVTEVFRNDDGTVTGVALGDDRIDADIVVWANPRQAWGMPEPRPLPVLPASRTLVRLAEAPSALAAETLVHINPPVRLFRSTAASGGDGGADDELWTIEHRSGEDVMVALARHGVDLRDLVLERHDLAPADLVTRVHDGWAWLGWRSMFGRPGVAPQGGFFHAGAHAHPGPRLEEIGLATAAIAAAIGPVAR